MKKYSLFYITTILIFGIALWFVLIQGKNLESMHAMMPTSVESPAADSEQTQFFSNLQRNLDHPLAVMIMQIFCIMIVARSLGYIMTKVGQPAVVGEIIAGIAMGPSMLGAWFPEFSSFLFPEESLRRLHVLSQIGLVLFMFVIGMELDIGILKKKAKDAIIVSHASIIFPYFLGVTLAYYLYTTYAPASIPFSAFALFMGIAMSITAFPVLARIIQERDLTHTPLGTIAITCAAADDITAWCLLALVVAIVSAGGVISAMASIIMAVVYVLFMWFIVRPVLRRLALKYDTPESVNKTVIAAVFGMLFLSSYLTEIIGIHALFGAFIAGVIMPQQKEFKHILAEKIEDVSLVVLLPLFFVFTGLRTHIGLLDQANMWGACFLIIGIAVLGKFVGSAVAARFVGQSWRDSLVIGALMNSRGLMELVVLNIGFDLGVLSVEIFTMMVLMALVTTFMTGPAITVIEYLFISKINKTGVQAKEGFHILIPFGLPRSGSRLLELAHYLNLTTPQNSHVRAIHFSPSTDISMVEAEQYEKEAFTPIRYTAERLGIPLKMVFRVTDNASKEIVTMARNNPHDIILVGSSRELFKDDKTGGKVGSLIHRSDATVGVFIDKGFYDVHTALFVISGVDDMFLLKYAKKYLEGNEKNGLTILDVGNLFNNKEGLELLAATELKGNFSLTDKSSGEHKDFHKGFDIAIVSLDFWDGLKKGQGAWLTHMPSVLVLNR